MQDNQILEGLSLQAGGTNSEPQDGKRTAESLDRVAKNDVTVVLPVLNEEKGVVAVIDDVLQNGYRNILVVDGYSTDNTVQAAQEKGVTVVPQHGRGKSGAIKTAVEQVSTPYLLVMDGDFTYDAADIERFLSHATRYDEIVGSRSMKNVSRLHRVGNAAISAVFNALFGTTFSDVCSGMYLLKSKPVRHLTLRTTGFSIEVELLAQMSVQGTVTEVPINYRKRIGEAKLGTWMAGGDIMKTIFELARLYNPVFLFSVTTASAAIPGLGIMLWVFWLWITGHEHVFHSAWALTGGMLLLLASQAFIIGTVALLLKRTELRIERIVRSKIEGDNL